MLVSGIKSRPVYAPLRPDPAGHHHVLAGQGAGAAALARLLAAMPAGAASLSVFCVPDLGIAPGTLDDWEMLRTTSPVICDTEPDLAVTLHAALARCTMGTRLYLAGTEGFIGTCLRIAAEFGMKEQDIQREHCGTEARRVFCTHCRVFNEPVTTNLVQCRGCGRTLLVRDHYSRRLAAFMGVQADAEVPGELPPVAEVYR